MSTVVNLNFAIGEPNGRAVWPTSDKEEAEEQPSQDIAAGTGLENESDEDYVDEEGYWEPRHIRVPQSIMWAIIALLSLGAAALAIWGLAHSTMTYGVPPVDAATTARLSKIRTELEAAGAPAAAMRYLAIATQPGLNIGDAIDALASANKALEPVSNDPIIVPLSTELHGILNDLSGRRYGPWTPNPTPLVSATPLPTLVISGP
jgi:hypothetical protein